MQDVSPYWEFFFQLNRGGGGRSSANATGITNIIPTSNVSEIMYNGVVLSPDDIMVSFVDMIPYIEFEANIMCNDMGDQ